MKNIPDGFYRVSAKALILNDEKKFLLVREEKGWELSGGGLEYGENPQECIKRELMEEMGINVKYVKDTPSYFITVQKPNGIRISNIIYETEIDINDIQNFKPSNECLEARFFNREEAENENLFHNVKEFIKQFDPLSH